MPGLRRPRSGHGPRIRERRRRGRLRAATSLYQSLPPAPDPDQADQPGEGQLLLFSDSRQAAAFFAPYLEISYETVQRRRLILEGMGRAAREESADVSDLAFPRGQGRGRGARLPRKMTAQERKRHTALWVMQELVTRGPPVSRRPWTDPGAPGSEAELAASQGITALGLDDTESLGSARGAGPHCAATGCGQHARGCRGQRRGVSTPGADPSSSGNRRGVQAQGDQLVSQPEG